MKRLAATACFAALIAGCSNGGGDKSSSSPSSSSTSTSSATTSTTLDAASQAAADIDAAEVAIANADTPTSEVSARARAQQAAYRALVEHPEWRSVLTSLAPPIRAAALGNIEAGEKLRQLSQPKRPTPPEEWRIVRPAPAAELLSAYHDAEREFGVPWGYLAAVHLVETRLGRIRGASSAGALGPMQFLPKTWEAYGEGDINSNRDSIRAAARYLKRNGAPADMRNALWNYNHSYLYVDGVTRYAERMLANERAFYAYYEWQVYYRTTNGDVLLPEGYPDKR